MPSKPSKLTELQQLALQKAPLSFWVVKRYLRQREAVYNVLKVEAEDKLRAKLHDLLKTELSSCTGLEEYSYHTDDQDEVAYTLNLSETDFAAIKQQVEKGSEAKHAKDADDLLRAWGYVIEVHTEPTPIYGFRQVSSLWSTKKVKDLWMNMTFKDQILIDLEEKEVFKIDRKLDFVGYEDVIYVLDKKQFESAMNFRVGMERKRDELLQEFEKLDLFHDLEAFRKKIQNNLRLLRRVAAIHSRGYYRDPGFVVRLLELNDEEGWGLDVNGARILVTEDNVELILTLMGNDRLESRINAEVFDVTVKKQVRGPGQK